jgi:biotin carboxyl carrier protein
MMSRGTTARLGERDIRLEVESRGGDRFRVTVDGCERAVEARERDGILLLRIGDEVIEAAVAPEGGNGGRRSERGFAVTIRGRVHAVVLQDPLHSSPPGQGIRIEGPVDLRSVMPGRIAAVLVEEGQVVAAGQGVVVVEAMKMENELSAPKEGRIASIQVRRGDTVEAGALLLRIE